MRNNEAHPLETIPDKFDAEWDAGDMGCGELVMQLSGIMRDLPAGAVLLLSANDPGAVEDIPSWCRMTKHRLLRSAHPLYFIERRN